MIQPPQNATSQVTRQVQRQRTVYIKRLLPSDSGRTAEVVRARAAREIELIERSNSLATRKSRFGSVRLVDSDLEQATIVTEEIPGRTLEASLNERSGRAAAYQALRACYLAGRWLRAFQQLPPACDDGFLNGLTAAGTLAPYCEIRLQHIQQAGDPWLTDERRRRLLETIALWETQSADSDRRHVWCHCDYAPGNMMWDGRVLTPIDFAMARPDVPLLDVTYFIHRLELLPIYAPWKCWPTAAWTRAFLRGYGRPHAEHAPMFRALMMRHWICRLRTYWGRPAANWKQQLHAAWIRRRVRARLQTELASLIIP